MTIEKIEGIIINELDSGESSKIINVLTKNKGVIGIMCKGAKKMKSKFSGVTGKLTYAFFHIYYKENKLSTLISVDVINPLLNLKTNIESLAYASYNLDLIKGVSRENSGIEVYEIFKNSLIKINEGIDPFGITNIVELKCLEFLGIKPILDRCVSCDKTQNIKTICAFKGGYICENCYEGEYIYSDKTLGLIRNLYYVDINNISKFDISNETKTEINRFITEYYDRYSGIYLKSKKFIEKFKI
ncbi:MAG: DNA repair protein RecO [Bacilli bacterium]